MTRTSSKEIQKQDQATPEAPSILTEGTPLALAPADRGAGSRADGHDEGSQPGDAAALTGDNGGGTSGNHGNGTAG
jgi:hypothetical protein